MKKLVAILLILSLGLPFAGCKVETTVDSTQPTQIHREAMGRIAETVLYHKDGIKVTATKLEQTINGGTIHVTIVNNTELPVSFASDDIIVNGITVTDGYCIETPAGGTAEGKIDISYRSMDNAHITNIAYIESPDARIFENVEFTTLDTASFRIETALNGSHAQLMPESGTVIYDKNGIKVQILGCVAGERVTDARLLVTNNTEGNIAIKCENPMADGKALNTWMFDTVYAGSSRYCCFEFAGIDHQNVTADLDLYSIGTEKTLIAELGSHSFPFNN